MEPTEVRVTVLLAGGHQYALTLPSNAPLLQTLVNTLVTQSQTPHHTPSGLLQLPLGEKQAALIVPMHQLVGLVTEPPVFVQQLQPTALQPTPTVLPSQVVQIDHFLTEVEQAKLLAYTLQKENEFVSSSTATGAIDYRRSLVLHHFPEFVDLISQRIQAVLPQVIQQLQIPTFTVSQIEAQLTAHNHGNFYKIHNDNGSPDAATRELTYVYYFYRQPKAFSGGELRLYHSRIEQGMYVQDESFQTVDPRHNSIVFFLSRIMHEVMPVSCPSQAFADSRFTINGWIRR